MTITITRTSDSATTLPVDLLGYQARREGRSTVTDLIDGSIAVTLVTPRLRTGTLRLPYATMSAATSALNLHATKDTYALLDSETTLVNMSYIVRGLDITFDVRSGQWMVLVDYQEIES